MWFRGAWLLFASCALAANPPTFTYTAPAGTTVAAMAVDAAGNTYLTGSTSSSTFPATPGALQTQFAGGLCDSLFTPAGVFRYPCTDAFVIKLDPSGNVLFATYLGGNGSLTVGSAICVDAEGNIFVGGSTSANTQGAPDTFPVTPAAAFANPATAGAFVAKLNAAGTRLIYATFLPLFPNYASYYPLAMAIDSSGNAYIASTTQSPAQNPVPVTPGAFQTSTQNKSVPGVVAKLNSSGSALVYATYLSGSNWDIPTGIAVDAAGDAFVTGYTGSQDFPVTPGAYQTTFPSLEYAGFVTKLNPQGTGLIYSTFTQISGDAGPWEIKVDSQGEAYVLGQALIPGSPTAMAIDGAYLSRLSADGSSLLYSTFLNNATGLDIDSAGNAFVAGAIGGASLTATPGAFQSGYGGGQDGFVMKFTPDGQMAGATYLGGSLDDTASFIAVAPNGSVVISGTTRSPDFPGIGGPILPNSAATSFATSVFASLTVMNAASYVPNTVAPGEIVSLLGYGIGPATGVGAGGPVLPAELGGVQVSFGGLPAPLLYAQSHVINAQVPWELAGQTSTTVQVSYPGVASTLTPVVVAPSLPGIFYVSNSDGTQNSPSNPAKPGDFITIYGTGGGPTSPAAVDGAFWPLTTPYPLLTLPVIVTVGSANATVLYAGASPLSPSGIFQINALLPLSLPASSASSLVVNIGGVSSAAVPIAIQ